MKKIALAIALEKYADLRIEAVSFAEKDAVRFGKSVGRLEVELAPENSLASSQATKQAIANQLQLTLQALEPEDCFYVYYAGRVFSCHGKNYLTTYNSQWDKLPETSLPLEPLLQQLQAATCQQIVLFIDNHPLATKPGAGDGNDCEPLQLEAWQQQAAAAPNCAVFLACQPEEDSYASGQLTHGIWSHHLSEAIGGKVPTALARGKLTVRSLQNYLTKQIPRTLRTTFSVKKKQSAVQFGGLPGEALLFDLRPTLAGRQEALTAGEDPLSQFAFSVTRTEPVKQLAGFKKSHRVPDSDSPVAQEFISRLAEGDLTQDVDAVAARLKAAFRFVRADTHVSVPGDGTGTIITPFFNYSIAVSLDPEDPSQVRWMRSVDAISEPKEITSTKFNSVFHNVFDTVEFKLPAAVQLEAFIDSVEALQSKNVQVRYDRGCSYCELDVKGFSAAIRVTSRILAMVYSMPQEPKLLIKSFRALQQAIVKQGVVLIGQ